MLLAFVQDAPPRNAFASLSDEVHENPRAGEQLERLGQRVQQNTTWRHPRSRTALP